MHPSLLKIGHRPWQLPSRKWKWRQSWLDLAFLHYPVAIEDVESLLPKNIDLDTFNDEAWIGLVPFRMAGVMRRPLPDMPFFSSFPELNLRTYVIVDGKPGVWFFSLDAHSHPIVFGGRAIYNLPYHYAECRVGERDGWHEFKSSRRNGGVNFEALYRPIGEEFYAARGSFEHWATERYCLYSSSKDGEIHRVEVHHEQWPLQAGEVKIVSNEIIKASKLTTLKREPICHYSRGVHVISYEKQKCQQGSCINPHTLRVNSLYT
jgi:uncharacterized protein YqjF (DUF2071 family)